MAKLVMIGNSKEILGLLNVWMRIYGDVKISALGRQDAA